MPFFDISHVHVVTFFTARPVPGSCGSSWILAALVKGHPDLWRSFEERQGQSFRVISSRSSHQYTIDREKPISLVISFGEKLLSLSNIPPFAITACLSFILKRVSAWQPCFNLGFPICHCDVILHRRCYITSQSHITSRLDVKWIFRNLWLFISINNIKYTALYFCLFSIVPLSANYSSSGLTNKSLDNFSLTGKWLFLS